MDPRVKVASSFPVEKVDFDWIDTTDKVSELKKGYKALQQQGGYYPELQKKLLDKIRQLDPKFKRGHEQQPDISKQQASALNQEFISWTQKMNEKDSKLRDGGGAQQQQYQIFGKDQLNGKMTKDQQELQILEKAKTQKQKGNDFMKSKDFKEALTCYTKSIELNGKDPTTYSNRSLAYINIKDFEQAKKDADKAIELQPDYVKAYHRRARVNQALGHIKEALKAFSMILRLEPQNQEAKRDVVRLKGVLKEKEGIDEKPREEGEFKRIAIESDSDESDDDDEGQKKSVGKSSQQDEKSGENGDDKQKGDVSDQEPKTSAEDKSKATDQEPTKKQQQQEQQPSMERKPSFWEQVDRPQEDQDENEFLQQIKMIKENVSNIKTKGNQQYKRGNFQTSLQVFNQALNALHEMPSGQEKTKIEASINNNIASCFKQMRDPHKVIYYTSKVIESQIQDSSLLGKAFCRRGFAQVELQNFRKALNDLKQANKHGFGKEVAVEIRNLQRLLNQGGKEEKKKADKEQTKTGKEQTKTGKEQTKTKKQQTKTKKQQTKSEPKKQPQQKPNQLSLNEIHKMIQNLKQQGNKLFQNGNLQQAIVKYSLAIGTYRKESRCQNNPDIKLIIKQCMSNRSQVYLKQSKYAQAIEDCSNILNYFDNEFRKCILRRGVCYNRIGKYDLSIKDLQRFCKIQPQNEQSKNQLNDSVKKFSEQMRREKQQKNKKQKDEKLKQYEEKKRKEEEKAKIEEKKKAQEKAQEKAQKKAQETKKAEEKKIQQKDASNIQQQKQTTKQQQQEKKQTKSEIKVRGKKISQKLLENATEKAKLKLGEMKTIPTSMLQFSTVWQAKIQNSNDSECFDFLKVFTQTKIIQQLNQNIPNENLKTIFNTSQIKTQLFIQILKLLKNFAIETDPKFVLNFLTIISKYESFKNLIDIQIQDNEKQDLKKLVQQDLVAKLSLSKSSKKIKNLLKLIDI